MASEALPLAKHVPNATAKGAALDASRYALRILFAIALR
jgi:hypothetical protein